MENMSNFELIKMYKRMLRDGLIRLAIPVQEEIFLRMEDNQVTTRPTLSVIKGGIA